MQKPDAATTSLRAARRLLAWTLLPTAAYMIYLAITGGEISFPNRRPGPVRSISWEESPIAYAFAAVPVYFCFYAVLLMLHCAGGVAKMAVAGCCHWVQRRWIRWAQWKPWRHWWWWPKPKKNERRLKKPLDR